MLAGHERVRRLYARQRREAEARRTGRIVDCFLRLLALETGHESHSDYAFGAVLQCPPAPG